MTSITRHRPSGWQLLAAPPAPLVLPALRSAVGTASPCGALGLACDNPPSADGHRWWQLITASATENADLFWGARRWLELRDCHLFESLHPLARCWGLLVYPMDKARGLQAVSRVNSTAPDELALCRPGDLARRHAGRCGPCLLQRTCRKGENTAPIQSLARL